jgi:hypothetical protein
MSAARAELSFTKRGHFRCSVPRLCTFDTLRGGLLCAQEVWKGGRIIQGQGEAINKAWVGCLRKDSEMEWLGSKASHLRKRRRASSSPNDVGLI